MVELKYIAPVLLLIVKVGFTFAVSVFKPNLAPIG